MLLIYYCILRKAIADSGISNNAINIILTTLRFVMKYEKKSNSEIDKSVDRGGFYGIFIFLS